VNIINKYDVNVNPWQPRFPCGTDATRILQDSSGSRFAVEKKLLCDKWDCLECGPRMIDEHISRAKYHFSRVVVYVGAVLLAKSKLSYFLRRNVKKPYMAIRTQNKIVIASGSYFPGSQGADKRKFLKDMLPGILGEIKGGRSVSYSRKKKGEAHKNNEGESYRCLALLRGNRAQAFNRLRSSKKIQQDVDHARFLRDHEAEGKLYPAGKELIKKLPALELEAERQAI